MVKFEISGSIDPILKVQLDRGDRIFCESGAMVAMDEALSLTGKAKGGFFSSLGRKLLDDESFFQQQVEAPSMPGEVLLSPALAGDICVLNVSSTEHYTMSDGCYLANTENVTIKMATQGLSKALFGGTGSGLKGFFTLKAEGEGQLVVSGFGSLRELEVTPEKPLLVDNGHLVAWSSELHYELSISTAHRGFFGSMVESVTSGEGIILKFTGRGKVIVCSRNRDAFADWILSRIPPQKD